MRLALAQLDATVGDVAANVAGVLDAYRAGVAAGADLVVTPELALSGYPPEDLVLKPAFVDAVAEGVRDIAAATGPVPLVVGFVQRCDEDAETNGNAGVGVHPALANAAAVCRDGTVAAVYRKQRLPNYGVFDEVRYFRPGSAPVVVPVAGARVGVTICEDLWGAGGPVRQACDAGAQLVVNLNASPYCRGKCADRERWVRHHARACGTWVAYCNEVGGQDEVVFDGDSFVMAPDGAVVARGAQFAADLVVVDVPVGDDAPGAVPARSDAPRLAPLAEVYAALVLGTRDYVRGNGFPRAVVGLSGGIDSALVAAIAADALGSEAVTGVAMPSPYSSAASVADAKQLAANLAIGWLELPIGALMDAFRVTLSEPFAGTTPGVAEENLQSRIRGTLLMALSNKRGDIVLATGNKSEYAVGYATLYGDMAGGFAVLKDVSKLLVYDLCRHRNAAGDGELIPQAILDKPPSAELRPGQRDTDSLPPYDVLDPILRAYVEQDRSVAEIVAAGYDPKVVRNVARLVDRAEYKRRQAAPGVKITPRAFGKDRRLPITQRWPG
ncbi:MAG: NAD+ synthase [Actinomycetota bacterium]|nr:NAD+ synthase [Actinomycetota bacterium]